MAKKKKSMKEKVKDALHIGEHSGESEEPKAEDWEDPPNGDAPADPDADLVAPENDEPAPKKAKSAKKKPADNSTDEVPGKFRKLQK